MFDGKEEKENKKKDFQLSTIPHDALRCAPTRFCETRCAVPAAAAAGFGTDRIISSVELFFFGLLGFFDGDDVAEDVFIAASSSATAGTDPRRD